MPTTSQISHRRFFHLCSSHQCSIVGSENVVLSDWSLVTYWEYHSVRTDVLIDKHRLLFGGKAYIVSFLSAPHRPSR